MRQKYRECEWMNVWCEQRESKGMSVLISECVVEYKELSSGLIWITLWAVFIFICKWQRAQISAIQSYYCVLL